MEYITRKSLLNKSKVEYADYAVNHCAFCSHGCTFNCYAQGASKVTGEIKKNEEWFKPKLVSNALALLEIDIPKKKEIIRCVHLSFMTDPFMYGVAYKEVNDLSLKIIRRLNKDGIKCATITKGKSPIELAKLSKKNEYGITLTTIRKTARLKLEPHACPTKSRINALYELHKAGMKTWLSLEPYLTPNFVKQDIHELLDAASFVDKIIFGRLNYNAKVGEYKDYKNFYNEHAVAVVEYCEKNGKKCFIKEKTITDDKLLQKCQKSDAVLDKEKVF